MDGYDLRSIRGGLSQGEAARRVGASQAQWSRWEAGGELPSLVEWCLSQPDVRRRLLAEKALVLPQPEHP